MSWTDVYPVFDEDKIAEYHESATAAEKEQLEHWYGIERIINPKPEQTEVISVSLFWKNVRAGDPDLPKPTLNILKNAVDLGYAKRFNPWDHYVLPLLKLTPGILEANPDATVRVYLANDLEFLIDDLTEAGCEVYFMKSSSINFAPGGLWRFLPFSEEGKLVTVTDTDRLNEINSDLVRTRAMAQAGVGAWRVPVPTDLTNDYRVCYLPFMGCQFGVTGGHLNVRELLDAFTWQCLREAVDYQVIFPNCGPLPIQAHTWPTYGFDEFFMNVAAYPRLAQEGMHTYVPGTASSQLLTLDIEYCTWGNPNSEVVYFPAGSCCGQAAREEDPTEASDTLEAKIVPLSTDIPPCPAPKLAFLFLTLNDINQPAIWNEYLESAGTQAEVFAHVKAREELASDAWISNHLIEDHIETEWGSLSLVEATLLLLETALAQSDCTHFALVSESCVPVRPFATLTRSLQLDPRSRMFIRSWEDERKTNVLKAQRVENLEGIRKEIAHFQSQWMCLSRDDAKLLCQRRLTDRFENCFAPDECYFATALAVLGRPPLQAVANRHFTWTDWSQRTKHPEEYDQISPQTASRIADSGCFFARKFATDSNIGEFGLHR